MSEQPQIDEHNGDAGFEHEDWSAGTVYAFLVGLAVVGIAVYFILRGMYAYLDARSEAHQPPHNPLVAAQPEVRNVPRREMQEQIKTTFPDPRLEENERQELTQFRESEEDTLNSYGWVDEPAGVVHIPIQRAMELIAQRGLPVQPETGRPSTAALGRAAGRNAAKQ